VGLRRRAVLATGVLAILAVAALVAGAIELHGGTASAARSTASPLRTKASGRSIAWIDKGIDVVGGPVASGGKVLVLVLHQDRSTWLTAIDPRTGSVSWSFRWSFSEITAGVITTPLAHGGTTLLLAPGAANDGLVRLEGVQIATGRVIWRGASRVYVTDAPSACPRPLGHAGFCIVVALPTGSNGLLAISPVNGQMIATVPNIERAISTGPGIYEAPTSNPVLVDVRTPGGMRWSKTVEALFGEKHNPNYGWDLDRYGGVDVGTVFRQVRGRQVALGVETTSGIDDANGRRIWTDPGIFQCGGVSGLRIAFLCRVTGTATIPQSSGTLVLSKDARAAIEGFDPATGRINWRVPVTDMANLLTGNVAIADSHHLVVTTRGVHRLLDLTTGKLTAAHATYWCMHAHEFTIVPPTGISNQRVGSSYANPCDERRRIATGLPRPTPTVGASIAGRFIYATRLGLVASNEPAPQ